MSSKLESAALKAPRTTIEIEKIESVGLESEYENYQTLCWGLQKFTAKLQVIPTYRVGISICNPRGVHIRPTVNPTYELKTVSDKLGEYQSDPKFTLCWGSQKAHRQPTSLPNLPG